MTGKRGFTDGKAAKTRFAVAGLLIAAALSCCLAQPSAGDAVQPSERDRLLEKVADGSEANSSFAILNGRDLKTRAEADDFRARLAASLEALAPRLASLPETPAATRAQSRASEMDSKVPRGDQAHLFADLRYDLNEALRVGSGLSALSEAVEDLAGVDEKVAASAKDVKGLAVEWSRHVDALLSVSEQLGNRYFHMRDIVASSRELAQGGSEKAAPEDAKATLGHLHELRSALAIYYGDMEGSYPLDLWDLAKNNRYLMTIPAASTGAHPPSKRITYYPSYPPKQPRDTGGWGYAGDPDEPSFGTLFIDCTHTDARGAQWTSY